MKTLREQIIKLAWDDPLVPCEELPLAEAFGRACARAALEAAKAKATIESCPLGCPEVLDALLEDLSDGE